MKRANEKSESRNRSVRHRSKKQTPATTRQRRRLGVPGRNVMKQSYDILHLQREHQAQHLTESRLAY